MLVKITYETSLLYPETRSTFENYLSKNEINKLSEIRF